MKILKRKAKRISDRPLKKKAINMNKSEKPSADTNQNIYSGSEKKMLDIVVKLIVKIIKKEVDL